jgi:hypothetical protein
VVCWGGNFRWIDFGFFITQGGSIAKKSYTPKIDKWLQVGYTKE